MSDGSPSRSTAGASVQPRHRLHVWPWLRRPAQKLVLPNWLAITIGRDIFSWRMLDEFELEHELCHVGQWDRYGLRYVPRYLLASRRAAAAGGDRYLDNVFEVEARQAADALRLRRAGEEGLPDQLHASEGPDPAGTIAVRTG